MRKVCKGRLVRMKVSCPCCYTTDHKYISLEKGKLGVVLKTHRVPWDCWTVLFGEDTVQLNWHYMEVLLSKC